jgi:hypothetical protein
MGNLGKCRTIKLWPPCTQCLSPGLFLCSARTFGIVVSSSCLLLYQTLIMIYDLNYLAALRSLPSLNCYLYLNLGCELIMLSEVSEVIMTAYI